MSFFAKVWSRIKRDGLKKMFRLAILKLLGVDQQQEQIDNLYYFINQYLDIEKFPAPKDEDLLIMQKCNMVMLGIFDKLCQKHNLTYWLAYGTLLGAVRHNGIIPWDDDMDISMPRDCYEKVKTLLEPELNKYGITIYDGNCYPLHRFGLGYDHLKTGIWCDIFPVDVFKTEISNFDESYSLLAPIVKRYRSKYYPYHGNVPERLELDKNKCFSSFYNGDYSLFVHNLDSTFKHCLISSYDMLYPLKRVPFGDYQFPIPSDTHSYLSVLYGKDYMSYPKGGILHHGEATGRAPLSTWAKSNGVNMQEVFSKLLEIYNKI